MPWTLIFVFTLFACSSAPSSKSQLKTSLETVVNFYSQYFSLREKAVVPYSRSFLAAIKENEEICKKYAGTDICGWGAGGDVFLNSQEYGSKLDMNNTKFTATPMEQNKVRVNFNVYPEMKDAYYDKELTYFMTSENGSWVIDDIEYKSGDTAKQLLKKEIQVHLPKK